MSFLKLMFLFLFCCFLFLCVSFFLFTYWRQFFQTHSLNSFAWISYWALSKQKTQKPKSMSSFTNISENTIWECFACFSHHFTSVNSFCAVWINDKVKWISHCMDTIAFGMTYNESAFTYFVVWKLSWKMSQVARNEKCAVCNCEKEMHRAYLMWRIKWKRIRC